MAVCRKCNTANEEGTTRCRACNAIMPVKMGSKSKTRWERVRRQPELVGAKCPKCGVVNPYTRFKCKDCGALLGKAPPKSGLGKIWMGLGIVLVLVAAVLFAMVRTS